MSILSKLQDEKLKGLVYGNRIILPFECEILKIVIDTKILTDFSPDNREALCQSRHGFTDIYFLDYKDLPQQLSDYELIKIIVVERGKDLFDFNNHVRLGIRVVDTHITEIEKLPEDSLFVE